MKLKYTFPILLALLFSSCSKDDDENTSPVNELEQQELILEIGNDEHIIELYNESGDFHTGHKTFSLRIKDKVTEAYIEDAVFSNWMPMMEMPEMKHSCPRSDLEKRAESKTVYDAFVVYQMTGMNGSGWSLEFDYSIGGTTYEAVSEISVLQSERQNVTVFTAADDQKYILALIRTIKI